MRERQQSSPGAGGRQRASSSGHFAKSSSCAVSSPVISIMMLIACLATIIVALTSGGSVQAQQQRHQIPAQQARRQDQDQNGFHLHDLYSLALQESAEQRASLDSGDQANGADRNTGAGGNQTSSRASSHNNNSNSTLECLGGLLTFELSTGFIYKPTSPADTLSMMPSTLQLTDCLDYCLHNSSCLAINFEMGLCVLLATSAQHHQHQLYSSQFPVFTIYAEKKCLLREPSQARHRRRCQRAWTFERVAGYEMKVRARRRLKLATKEACMDACLAEAEFECRSANWYRQTGECTLSDQDRHSVSQSEAGDQQIKSTLGDFYGPAGGGGGGNASASAGLHTPQYYNNHLSLASAAGPHQGQLYGSTLTGSQLGATHQDRSRLQGQLDPTARLAAANTPASPRPFRQLYGPDATGGGHTGRDSHVPAGGWPMGAHSQASADNQQQQQHYVDLPASTQVVDYLENNCIYEPNKLCEFRKIQNKVLKTVDSIYQDVASLDECRQKCLSAPYRCYSFDYGDTSERVCRTSHLDQASLLSVNEPYLEVVGAITYELAACFNVSIQCRAKEMVALVSSSKTFNGKIYAKSRPASCMTDVKQSLQFELAMRYHDEACDVRASSNQFQGVFSQDIVIQHHDRIVTTQDVGLSVYCQYDLGNRSVTNNVDLAIERLPDGPVESKHGQQQQVGGGVSPSSSSAGTLTITGLATTVVRSPNVTMRITNMNGLPVTSATVGDRLALMFEIKEKTSPFGILVREIVAMDGRQQQVNNATQMLNSTLNSPQHHYYGNAAAAMNNETALATPSNSIQFLDSDGCPTDANLMGPLVRMDPHGHRLLAPFDAFKFPTSDMVFFRAVVSSCVAECKPALCPPAAGSTGGGQSGPSLGPSPPPMILSDLAGADSSPYGDSAISSLAPPDDNDSDLIVATTRNMQTSSPALATTRQQQHPIASTGTTKQFVLTASTSTTVAPPSAVNGASTAPLPSGQQQVSSDRANMSPAGVYETLERTTKQQLATMSPSAATGGGGGGGDSLTTVAGFQVDQQQQQSTTAASDPSALSSSLPPADIGGAQTEPSRLEQHATINMTNNHNLGRPSPRPLTTTTTTTTTTTAMDNADLHGGASERHPVGPPSPAKLDPLTAQERQAILDLLSGHDKSPSSLLSAATSSSSSRTTVVDSQAAAKAPAAGSQLYNEETVTSGLMKLYPILDSFRYGNSRSRGLVPVGAEPMSSRMVLDEIRAIISDQYQLGDALVTSGQQPVATEPRASAAAGVLPRPQKSKRSHLPFADNRQFVEFINRTLIDYIIAEELKSLLLTQMLLDEARSSLPPDASGSGADKSARSLSTNDADNTGLAERENLFPLARLNNFSDKMGWPRITPVYPDGHLLSAGPEVSDAEAQPSLTFLQAQRLVKAQFDNQLAADIQHILKLLDDTKHADARQEIRRSKRQVEEDNLMISNNYVYLSQPQRGPHGLAARGHVEMYRGERPPPPATAHAAMRRFKREDASHKPEVATSSSEFEAHNHDSSGHASESESEGPKYEMDEMIVQSIKIVDRLQFEDELRQQQQRKRPTSGNRSSTRQDSNWSTTLAKQKQLRLRPESSASDLANEVAQAQLGDLSPALASGNRPDAAQQPPVLPRSRLSALNVILVALCFIFIQVSMVLVCVIDWNQRRKQQMLQQQQQRRSLFANLGSAGFSSTGLASASSACKRGGGSSFSHCSSVADTLSFHSPTASSSSSSRAATVRLTNSRAPATSEYPSHRNQQQHAVQFSHTLGRRDERNLLYGTAAWPATRAPQ